jgi:hypothetical protein
MLNQYCLQTIYIVIKYMFMNKKNNVYAVHFVVKHVYTVYQ